LQQVLVLKISQHWSRWHCIFCDIKANFGLKTFETWYLGQLTNQHRLTHKNCSLGCRQFFFAEGGRKQRNRGQSNEDPLKGVITDFQLVGTNFKCGKITPIGDGSGMQSKTMKIQVLC